MITMAENFETFDIVDGPNRDFLFDACKYVNKKNVSLMVDLTIADGYKKSENGSKTYIPLKVDDIKVTGITRKEDENKAPIFNDELILHGICRADLSGRGEGKEFFKAYHFEACYNTKTRKGSVYFL